MITAFLRIQRNRASHCLDCRIEVAEVRIRHGEIQQGIRIIGTQVHRLLELVARSREIVMQEPLHKAHRSMRLGQPRSEEQTSELQSLMRISYAVFCLTKK